MCFMALLCAVHNYDVACAEDSMYERSSSELRNVLFIRQNDSVALPSFKGVDEPLPFAPLLHKAPTQGRHEWKLMRNGLLPF